MFRNKTGDHVTNSGGFRRQWVAPFVSGPLGRKFMKYRISIAVADGPHDADLCTLKAYQQLRETHLPQTMFVLQSTDSYESYHRPSKLYALSVSH